MTSIQNSTETADRARDEIRVMMRASSQQDRIVHRAYEPALYDELLAACDDSADCGGIQEFWGEGEDEGEWRIHLTDCPVDDAGRFVEAE